MRKDLNFRKFLLMSAGMMASLNVVFAQLPAEVNYRKFCASCHGATLSGGNAQSLVDGIWQFGADNGYIVSNIKYGITHLGMPSYKDALTDKEINDLVSYIRESEKKAGATRPPLPEKLETLDYNMKVEVFAENLQIPWAIDFIDGNTALITERPGRLRLVQNGKLISEPVKGTPAVLHEGQGGLLDVAVDPEYKENGWIYLAYSHALKEFSGDRAPSMTRIVRGQIKDNNWISQQVIFEAPHETYRTTRHHYGCRIVFDPWGYLYFAIGDRGAGDQAQMTGRPNGKVHRINRDGSIPPSNPFVTEKGAMGSLFTLGNRNIQGMAVHPETGQVWATEHGPMGGDELNLIQSGKNYGWEVITYGINYNGAIISEFTHKPGMEQPVVYWRPSIAVCGLDFCRGDLFPKWKNRLMVGALRYEEVRLLSIEKDRVMHQETILKNAGRVRDVACGPEGAIYVVLNNPDKVIRLIPLKD